MHIESLKFFCQVVEQGSVSQVARTNYVTQPAVTSKIRQLENHYGVALFNRNSGMLRVTEAGARLYPYAKEIVHYFNRSEEVMTNLSIDNEEPLHIGASLTIGEYLLPDILGKIQNRHPKFQFSLTIGNTPTIISKLESLDIDIALVEGIVRHKDFQIEKFAEDELLLIIPQNHHWSDRNEITIEEVVKERILIREKASGARKIIETMLMENNVLEHIHSYLELGSTQAIKSGVKSGLGIGIVPRHSVEQEIEHGAVKHLPISNITVSRNLWIVTRPTRFPKSSLHLFKQFLKEAGFRTSPSRKA